MSGIKLDSSSHPDFCNFLPSIGLFATMGHMTYPPLNFILGGDRTGKFEAYSIEVQIPEILRGFVWEKVAGGQTITFNDLKMLPFPNI